MNYIVLWSGGPHSTYAIYSLIKKGHRVMAVHVKSLQDKKISKKLHPIIKYLMGDEIELTIKEVNVSGSLTWTKLLTMGVSAAHWIEARALSNSKGIPTKDSASTIYLGTTLEGEEVRKLINAISPDFPIREFQHTMDDEELVDVLNLVGLSS